MQRQIFSLSTIVFAVLTCTWCAGAIAVYQDDNQSQVPLATVLSRKTLTDANRIQLQEFADAGVESLPLDELQQWLEIGSSKKNASQCPPRHHLHYSGLTQFSNTPFLPEPTRSTTVTDLRTHRYSAQEIRTDEQLSEWSGFLQPTFDHFYSRHKNRFDEEANAIRSLLIELVDKSAEEMSSENTANYSKQLENLTAGKSALRNDPLVNAAFAILLAGQHDYQMARESLKKSVVHFHFTDYPAHAPCFFVSHFYGSVPLSREESAETALRLVGIVEHWIRKDFSQPPIHHEQALLLAERAIEQIAFADDLKTMNEFDRVIAGSSHLPEWLLLMLRAKIQLEISRIALANKKPGIVNRSQQQAVVAAKRSDEYYRLAHESNPLSASAANRLQVLTASSREDNKPDEWFLAAIERQPRLLASYQIELQFLSIRANQDQLIQGLAPIQLVAPDDFPQPKRDAIECILDIGLNRTAASDDSEFQSKLILEAAKYLIRAKPQLSATSGLTERETRLLKAAMEAAKKLSTQETVFLNGRCRAKDYFSTALAVLATRLGDVAVADAALSQLSTVSPEATIDFGSRSSSLNVFWSDSYALMSEYQEEAILVNQIMQLPRAERRERARELISLCDRVLKTKTNAANRIFFEKSKSKVTLERTYDAGLPVRLDFGKELSLWRFGDFRQAQWIAPGTLRLDNRVHSTPLEVAHLAQFPGAKIVEFDLKLPLDPDRPSKTRMDAAFDFAPGLITHESHDNVAFGATISKQKQSAESEVGTRFRIPYVFMNSLNRETFHVRIFASDQYLELYVNGEFITRSRWFSKRDSVPVSNLIRFGQIRTVGIGVAEISNVRVRRVSCGTPPLPEDGAAQVAFFEQFVDEQPEDPWGYFWLGQAYHRQKEIAKALNLYLKAKKLELPDEALLEFWKGDAYDRMKEFDKAVASYSIAADPKRSVGMTIPVKEGFEPYRLHQNWAAFRVKWHREFRSSEISSSDLSVTPALPRAPKYFETLEKILSAQQLARQSNFSEASKLGQESLRSCPLEIEDDVILAIRYYRRERLYREKDGTSPLYLKVPQFRILEDIERFVR